MRHLILMRGAQGAGKSTFITAQGLDAFALSPDRLRLDMGGIVMLTDGRLTLNPRNDRKVWEDIERLLEQKMSRGEFIILDATFQSPRDFKTPLMLANRHGYAVTCLDFSGVPVEVAKARNRLRPEWKQVPDEVIDRAYERFAAPLPKGLKVLRPEDLGDRALRDHLAVPMRDLNAYKKVHHIGDLQGCHAPLAEYLADGIRNDEYYIFVGDFLDRGIENDKVIRYVVDELLPRDNVALIFGNHELHIQRYAHGLAPVSKEFEHGTLPQLLAANFTIGEAHRLCAKLIDVLTYTYGPHKVLVSHAGIARVPDDLVLLPSLMFWKGTGTYDDPVDAAFSATMGGTGWIQVHGHRNSARLPIQAGPLSFNLESEVEFGGYLSVMTLDPSGAIDTVRVENRVHRKEKPSAFVTKPDGPDRMADTALAALKAHPAVQEKRFVHYPHIRSYNFTRKAFEKGLWDQVTLRARGLFVGADGQIVARSYDKFFNLEERTETEMRNLSQTLAFPLTLWVKENGFLGILGYDAVDDALFFASKSTPESEFAGWFRDILTAQVGPERLEALKARLREDNLTLVFEVNDPVNDPHMIEYADRHVVLLEAIHRTEAFSCLPTEGLAALGADFGLRIKAAGPRFDDFASFKTWYGTVQAQGRDYVFEGQHLEGFVVEDAAGFRFKIKLPFYSFWKAMRGLKDKLARVREGRTEVDAKPMAARFGAEAVAFAVWANGLPEADLKADIITLRKRFLSEA